MRHRRPWLAGYVLLVLVLLVLGTVLSQPIISLCALVLTLPVSLLLQGIGFVLTRAVDDEGVQSAIGFVLLMSAALVNAAVVDAVLRRREQAPG